MRHFLLVATFLGCLSACGGAKEGGSCGQSGFLCADSSAALECKLERWVRLPCKGPGGCKREGDVIRCDMSANTEGDACASTAEGKGLCSFAGNATLECREGALVKTNDCTSCSVSGEQVICQR